MGNRHPALPWAAHVGPFRVCPSIAAQIKPPADPIHSRGGHRLRRLPTGTRPRRGHGHTATSPLDSPGGQSELPPWFWGRFLGFLPAGTELVSPDPPGRLRCSGTAPVSGACQRAPGTRLSVCLSVSTPLSLCPVSWVRFQPRRLPLAFRSPLSASTRQDGTGWASGLGAEPHKLSSPQHPAGAMGSGGSATPNPPRASLLIDSPESSLGKHSLGLCAPSQAVRTFSPCFFLSSPCLHPGGRISAASLPLAQRRPQHPGAGGRAARGPSQQEEGAQPQKHHPLATCPLRGSADSWSRAGSPGCVATSLGKVRFWCSRDEHPRWPCTARGKTNTTRGSPQNQGLVLPCPDTTALLRPGAGFLHPDTNPTAPGRFAPTPGQQQGTAALTSPRFVVMKHPGIFFPVFILWGGEVRRRNFPPAAALQGAFIPPRMPQLGGGGGCREDFGFSLSPSGKGRGAPIASCTLAPSFPLICPAHAAQGVASSVCSSGPKKLGGGGL